MKAIPPARSLVRHVAWILVALALRPLRSSAEEFFEPYTFDILAGVASNPGGADGTGSAARFNGPQGLAVDSLGNVHVADSFNGTVRKVTSAGVVTTLAGWVEKFGSEDGSGSAARFGGPSDVAVDGNGNVYVADRGNHTIRKVTPAGVVTTLAGLAGSQGSADGTGSAARFNFPQGVALDSLGNVYVADTENYTIRRVTPEGVVTTLAGLAGSPGSTDGIGSGARFMALTSVAVDSAGNLYACDTTADQSFGVIRKVTRSGQVTTFAVRSYTDSGGERDAAWFFRLTGVAVDNAGNVYVTEWFPRNGGGFGAIRMVTPTGVVKTLAEWISVCSGVAVDSEGNI